MKLKNSEIWEAYPKLVELSRVKLPVKTSLKVAKLANKLRQPFSIIDGERNKLVQKYGTQDKETKLLSVQPDNENAPAFFKEFNELMEIEWDEDFELERVRLPEKITGTCDKCHHNMDVSFLIEPEILMPLAEHFIEVI